MRRRRYASGFLLALTLIIPAASLAAEEKPVPRNHKQVLKKTEKLTEEDRQVIEMIDLLEILELLNELDNITALEEKR